MHVQRGSLRALALAAVLLSGAATASETDQYFGRDRVLGDSRQALNARVNGAIDLAIAEWRGHRDDLRFAKMVRWKADGRLVFNRFSFWASEDDRIDRIELRGHSIYLGLSPLVSMIPVIPFLSSTLAVSGNEPGREIRFGTDKLSHLMAMGYEYYESYRRSGDLRAALEYGRRTERSFYGTIVTGVFSNADLVANYDGYRFYRSLVEDGIVRGRPALVRWRDGRPVRQRSFDIADHVSEYWDESINTSNYRAGVRPHVLAKLQQLCPDYRSRPQIYDLDAGREAELDRRYAPLRLRHNKRFRLSRICAR